MRKKSLLLVGLVLRICSTAGKASNRYSSWYLPTVRNAWIVTVANAGRACRAIINGLLLEDLTLDGLKLYSEHSHSSAASLHATGSSDAVGLLHECYNNDHCSATLYIRSG